VIRSSRAKARFDCHPRIVVSQHFRSSLGSCAAIAYHGTLVHVTAKGIVEVERVQTGVRLEKRLLKVLKAVAELKDMSLGDLLEGIVLHAFEGKSAFSPRTLKEIDHFRNIYGMTLHASDSHKLKETK
jgi:hypothetical protein